MNNQNQKALAVLAFALLTAPVTSQAVTLQIDSNGILTGATAVNVGGTLYNVQFLDGTCVSLFTGCDNAADDFTFTTLEDAALAAQALFDQVLTNSVLGQFDGHPELTNGCADVQICGVNIPYAVANGLLSGVIAVNLFAQFDFDEVFPFDSGDPNLNLANFGTNAYAVWSFASVPEPGTLALFGLGLLGLAVTRRRAN